MIALLIISYLISDIISTAFDLNKSYCCMCISSVLVIILFPIYYLLLSLPIMYIIGELF
jgi:hypothetical protein